MVSKDKKIANTTTARGNDEPNPRFYQELFDDAPSPAAIFDLHGRCQLANQAFNHRLGYLRAELTRKPFHLYDLFESAENAEDFITGLQKQRLIHRREAHFKDSQGRIFPVLVSGRIFDRGEHPGFQITFTDISLQKDVQRSIRSEHIRLVSLIESITAGLFLVSNDGLITGLNMALGNMLSLERETLVGEPYQTLFAHLINNALEPEVAQQMLSTAVLNVTEHPSLELALKQDNLRNVEIGFFPIWDEDGLPLGWGGLVQDVTEIRTQAAWKLELLSILAHDIRTPLATLKGHATALLANYQNWGNDMVTEFLEAIDRGIDELVHQVDRNLALTRVETGRLGLRPEAVQPARLVRQAVERAAGTLLDIPVELDLPEDLPRVRADPARAEEVIVNLLENAAHFSPPGQPILIRVQVERNWLKISVIDRGPGVPKEKQGEIFEKYMRAENEGGGTGLGLFISRKIVEAHGGRIWVKSPPAGAELGSEFAFRLPLMPVSTQDNTIPTEGPIQIPSKAIREGLRVLVVEDESDVQALMRAILTEEDYQVEVAPDGPTALDIIQASPPQLILLDWMLPGMNGLSVCRNIRRWSKIPIIMVTSKSSQEDLIAALNAGADDYVIKPFMRGELLARIRAVLRRGESWAVEEKADRFSGHGLLIDFATHQAWMNGELLVLTPTEYDLLAYMARHPRQLLTYDQLIENVWGIYGEGTRHGLFVHISRLRKKIEPNPDNPELIVTRWRVGYVFLPELSREIRDR